MDLQLLKTLCNENECNGEEVQSFILVIVQTHFLPSVYLFSSMQTIFAGEECIPDQFLGFPGVSRLFEVSRFSSGRCGHLLCCLVSISYHLALAPIFECFYVSDSCWLFPLLLLHVWFHINGVRKNVYSSRGSTVASRGSLLQRRVRSQRTLTRSEY